MPDVQLLLEAPASAPLDEALVGVVTLVGGSEAVRVSARLNLIEGDLSVAVTGPAGGTVRCAWPWPVDARPRWSELGPGARLSGAVPLLATGASQPLFPQPGAYTLTATFDAAPGVELHSEPCHVVRTVPEALGRAEALQQRDVLQSLLSASVLGGAADGLAELGSAGTATTRSLAALARDTMADVLASVDAGDTGSTAEIVETARAVSAVLPPGYADADPRRAAVEPLLDRHAEARALFQGSPS